MHIVDLPRVSGLRGEGVDCRYDGLLMVGDGCRQVVDLAKNYVGMAYFYSLNQRSSLKYFLMVDSHDWRNNFYLRMSWFASDKVFCQKGIWYLNNIHWKEIVFLCCHCMVCRNSLNLLGY